MALAGNKKSWQQLWSLLLGKASRKTFPVEAWRSGAFNPLQDAPVQMQVETTDSLLTKAMVGNTTIYLSQNDLLPYLWQGIYWPEAAGWQTLPQVNTAGNNYWYVYKKGDWQQLFNHQHTMATQQYAASHPLAESKALSSVANGFMAGIRFWLMLVFLAACIFLWVEQKAG
jgi:hypothetical protein